MDYSVPAKVQAANYAGGEAESFAHKGGGGVDVVDDGLGRGANATDPVLRFMAFAILVCSVAVVATSNQTKMIGSDEAGWIAIQAKFSYSPAIIYFIVAATIGCAYFMVTAVVSTLATADPGPAVKIFFAFFDSLMAGVIASATGAMASIAYVGLKGNDHIGWQKVCDIFGKFCRHVGSAIALAVLAIAIQLLLVGLSLRSLHCRLRVKY